MKKRNVIIRSKGEVPLKYKCYGKLLIREHAANRMEAIVLRQASRI